MAGASGSGGNASTGSAGGGNASGGDAGGGAPAPQTGGQAGGQSADTPSQGEAKGEETASASTETRRSDSPGSESTRPDGAGEAAADTKTSRSEQGGEHGAPGAEETKTGEPATGRAGEAAAEAGGEPVPKGEEPRGDVADEVLRDVPPPDPEPVAAARDAWNPVIKQAEQARDNGRGGANAVTAAWHDDGGAAVAERGEASVREADDVAQGARPVKELLDSTAGDFARTRDQMVSSAVHAEGNARVAEALAGSEPEAQLAKAWFKDSAVKGNLELRAATNQKVNGDWESLGITGTAPQPGQDHTPPSPAGAIRTVGNTAGPVDPGPPPPAAPGAGQPAPDAAPGAGTVPEATQNLDNAQDALAEAGRIIANLPTPPSDADLLRDYQVGDDPMIEVFDKTVTLSEAAASFRNDDTLINPANPYFHYEIENTATAAGQQVFPDPDGDGPSGGRTGTGDNHRDAFRHAYWSAAMTRAFGVHSAEAVGTGHERRPDDPVPDTPPQFAERQEAMDLYNNQIGRQIATALGPGASDEDVRGVIEQAIRDGKLVVFNNERSGLVPSGGVEDFPAAPPR